MIKCLGILGEDNETQVVFFQSGGAYAVEVMDTEENTTNIAIAEDDILDLIGSFIENNPSANKKILEMIAGNM